MVRPLAKNWKLYAIAIPSLAIAMALSVVALSLSNAILLRPQQDRIGQTQRDHAQRHRNRERGNRDGIQLPVLRQRPDHLAERSTPGATYSHCRTLANARGSDQSRVCG